MKILKRVFFVVLILVAVSVSAVITLGFVYEDRIIDYVKTELSNELTREVTITSIDFSVFKNFPNLSVELNEVSCHSFSKGDKDFIQLGSIDLVFNLLPLIQSEIQLNEINFSVGELNIIKNSDGTVNYHLFKTKNDSSPSEMTLNIDVVNLKDVKVSYVDDQLQSNYEARFDNAQLFPVSIGDEIHLKLVSSGELLRVKTSELDIVKPIVLSGETQFNSNNDTVNIGFDGIFIRNKLTFQGSIVKVAKGDFWDLLINTDHLNLNEVYQYLPKEIISQEFLKLNGQAALNVSYKGLSNLQSTPDLDVGFNLSGASYVEDSLKFSALTAKGHYRFLNGNTASLDVVDISSVVGGILVSGAVKIKDFNTLDMDIHLKSKFNLNKLERYIDKSVIEKLSGNAIVNTNWSGRLVDLFANKKKWLLSKLKTSGDISFQNGSVVLKALNYPIYFDNIDLQLANNKLEVTSFIGRVKATSFKLYGQIDDFFNTVLFDEQLNARVDVTADSLVLENFISTDTASINTSEEYQFNLPKNLFVESNFQLKYFKFRKFEASNLAGSLKLKNQKLDVSRLILSTCGGSTEAKGSVSTLTDKVVFKVQSKLLGINAQRAFYQFENFGQDVMLPKHVKGDIDIQSYLILQTDKSLNFKDDDLYTETDFTILNGELIGFEPLIELQYFLNKDLKLNFDLKHLKFSRLSNTIEVRQGVIFIPEMQILSNAINLDIAGSHAFNQDIDYLLKVKHSEIFKANKANEIEAEFGVKNNPDKTATLPLRMKGNMDDPKFTYDVKEKKVLVKESWKKERQEIKNAFKEEFGGLFKKDKDKESEEELLEIEGGQNQPKTIIIFDEDEDDEEEDDYDGIDDVKYEGLEYLR